MLLFSFCQSFFKVNSGNFLTPYNSQGVLESDKQDPAAEGISQKWICPFEFSHLFLDKQKVDSEGVYFTAGDKLSLSVRRFQRHWIFSFNQNRSTEVQKRIIKHQQSISRQHISDNYLSITAAICFFLMQTHTQLQSTHIQRNLDSQQRHKYLPKSLAATKQLLIQSWDRYKLFICLIFLDTNTHTGRNKPMHIHTNPDTARGLTQTAGGAVWKLWMNTKQLGVWHWTLLHNSLLQNNDQTSCRCCSGK